MKVERSLSATAGERMLAACRVTLEGSPEPHWQHAVTLVSALRKYFEVFVCLFWLVSSVSAQPFEKLGTSRLGVGHVPSASHKRVVTSLTRFDTWETDSLPRT